MKTECEQTYIEDLIIQTKNSISFFSNAAKKTRERSVCAALFRCIGIEFTSEEIIPNNDDPPDVIFKTARFEVIEIYDKGRKRHNEYRQRLEDLGKARSLKETLVPFYKKDPVSHATLINEILLPLDKKSLKYGKKFCSSLDALAYIGLPNRFLDINSPIPMTKKLVSQGWRSVSFVFPPYSCIVLCESNAPQFLTQFDRQTRMEWKKSDGLFDLE